MAETNSGESVLAAPLTRNRDTTDTVSPAPLRPRGGSGSPQPVHTSGGRPPRPPSAPELAVNIAAAKNKIEGNRQGKKVDSQEVLERESRLLARQRMTEKEETWKEKSFFKKVIPRWWKYGIHSTATYSKEKNQAQKLLAEGGLSMQSLPYDFQKDISNTAAEMVKEDRSSEKFFKRKVTKIKDLIHDVTITQKSIDKKEVDVVRSLRKAALSTQAQIDGDPALKQFVDKNGSLLKSYKDVLKGDFQASEGLAKRLGNEMGGDAIRAAVGEQKAESVEFTGDIKDFFTKEVITPLLKQGLQHNGTISEDALLETRTKIQEVFFTKKFVDWRNSLPADVQAKFMLSLSYGTDIIPAVQEVLLPQALAIKEQLQADADLKNYVDNIVLKVNVGTLKSGEQGDLQESKKEKMVSRGLTNQRVHAMYQEIAAGNPPALDVKNAYGSVLEPASSRLTALTARTGGHVTAGLAVGGGMYLAQLGASSVGRVLLPLVGGSLVAGAVRGMQERGRFTREVEQHRIEASRGVEFDAEAKRRNKMKELEMPMGDLSQVITRLASARTELKSGTVSQESLIQTLGMLADIDARRALMDLDEGLELWKGEANTSRDERDATLALRKAQATVALRDYLTAHKTERDAVFTKLGITASGADSVDLIVSTLQESRRQNIRNGTPLQPEIATAVGWTTLAKQDSIQGRDKAMHAARRKAMISQGTMTFTSSLVGGLGMQEGMALILRGMGVDIGPTALEKGSSWAWEQMGHGSAAREVTSAAMLTEAFQNSKPGDHLNVEGLGMHTEKGGKIVVDSIQGHDIKGKVHPEFLYQDGNISFQGKLPPELAEPLHDAGFKIEDPKFFSDAIKPGTDKVAVPGHPHVKVEIPQGTHLAKDGGGAFKLMMGDKLLADKIHIDSQGGITGSHVLPEYKHLVHIGEVGRNGESVKINTADWMKKHSTDVKVQWMEDRPSSEGTWFRQTDSRVGDHAIKWDSTSMHNTSGSHSEDVAKVIKDKELVRAFWEPGHSDNPILVKAPNGVTVLDQNSHKMIDVFNDKTGHWEKQQESVLAKMVFAKDLGKYDGAYSGTGFEDKINMNVSTGQMVTENGKTVFKEFATDLSSGKIPDQVTANSTVSQIDILPTTTLTLPSEETSLPVIPLPWSRRPLEAGKQGPATTRQTETREETRSEVPPPNRYGSDLRSGGLPRSGALPQSERRRRRRAQEAPATETTELNSEGNLENPRQRQAEPTFNLYESDVDSFSDGRRVESPLKKEPIQVGEAYYKSKASERLRNNNLANLDFVEEATEYLHRQDPEYKKILEGYLSQEGMQEPMDENCDAIVCIPVYTLAEGKTVRHALDQYAIQIDKTRNKQALDPSKFEIVIFLNHPRANASDPTNPTKSREGLESVLGHPFTEGAAERVAAGNPEIYDTEAAIQQFQQEHPELRIRVMKEEFPERPLWGNLTKRLYDVALLRSMQRANPGRRDPSIITNDIDVVRMSPTYIRDILQTMELDELQAERDPTFTKIDGISGRMDLGQEVYKAFPELLVSWRLFNYMFAVRRAYGLYGANTILRGSTYAALGGINPNRDDGTDGELAGMVWAVREDIASMPLPYSGKAWLETDPRRQIKTFLQGRSQGATWSDWAQMDIYGSDWKEDIAKLPDRNLDEMDISLLQREINSRVADFPEHIYPRALGFLGLHTQAEYQEIIDRFEGKGFTSTSPEMMAHLESLGLDTTDYQVDGSGHIVIERNDYQIQKHTKEDVQALIDATEAAGHKYGSQEMTDFMESVGLCSPWLYYVDDGHITIDVWEYDSIILENVTSLKKNVQGYIDEERWESIDKRSERILEREPSSLVKAPGDPLGNYTMLYDDYDNFDLQYADFFMSDDYAWQPDSGVTAPVILDIGGDIGMSALYWKTKSPDALVTTIEPDLEKTTIAEKNVKKNGLEDVVVLHSAIAGPEAKISQFITEPVDLVRIGAEAPALQVLQEAESKLAFVNEFIVEYPLDETSQVRLSEMLAFFDSHGFDTVTLIQDGKPVTLATVDFVDGTAVIIKTKRSSVPAPVPAEQTPPPAGEPTGEQPSVTPEDEEQLESSVELPIKVDDILVQRDSGDKFLISQVGLNSRGEPIVTLSKPGGMRITLTMHDLEAALAEEDGPWSIAPKDEEESAPEPEPEPEPKRRRLKFLGRRKKQAPQRSEDVVDELLKWQRERQEARRAAGEETGTGTSSGAEGDRTRLDIPVSFQSEQFLINRAFDNDDVRADLATATPEPENETIRQALEARGLDEATITNLLEQKPSASNVEEVRAKIKDRITWWTQIPKRVPSELSSMPAELQFTDEEFVLLLRGIQTFQEKSKEGSNDFLEARDVLLHHGTF